VSRIFVDTSALITLLDGDDPRHSEAQATFAAVIREELIAHGYIVAETIAVARRRFGVAGVLTLLDELLPVMTIAPVEIDVHTAAQARYRDSLPSGTSFVDQVSRTFMERESITTAFALDPDLVQPGLTLIPRG
jgi:predicted nucleic acid-binding protein